MDSLTIGDWQTETASCTALDAALLEVGLWHVYPEVTGTLIQPRPGQVERSVRIDRILLPTPQLVDSGWGHGAIGVEIKRSGVKIGPPIAQAMDYTRAVWSLPNGVKVMLDWVFIWPMERQIGTVASILAQQRIGCAYNNCYTTLHLKAGEANVIKIHRDGTVDIGSGSNGKKVGSR